MSEFRSYTPLMPAPPRPPRARRSRRAGPARGRVATALLAVAGLVVVLLRLGLGPRRRPAPGPLLRAAAAGLALATLLLVLRATAPTPPAMQVSSDAPAAPATERVEGVVLATTPLGTSDDAAGAQRRLAQASELTIRIISGSPRGRIIHLSLGTGSAPSLVAAASSYYPGDRVILNYLPQHDTSAAASAPNQPASGSTGASGGSGGQDAAGDEAFELVDHVRWPWLIWGLIVLGAVVIAVARGQGLRALVGLGTAVGVLWWFIIPRLLVGQAPVPVALLGCALIAIPALLLTNGIGRASLVPLAGIGGSLVAVWILTAGAVSLARLSGMATSEELNLVYVGTHGVVNPQGLLMAGILVGAVGGLVDVTVGQASAIFELHDADPAAPRGSLFRRGMNIGRAHVAAAVHTLVLAYAGAALPFLLLLAMYSGALSDLWNREFIASELLRSVAGSIGLAAAMPLTTWLACLTCRPALEAPGTHSRGATLGEPSSVAFGTSGTSGEKMRESTGLVNSVARQSM